MLTVNPPRVSWREGFLTTTAPTTRGRDPYSSAMNTLPMIGAFVWFIGLCVLIINTVGDSGTPAITHVDVLGLGMSVSGAILARGLKA